MPKRLTDIGEFGLIDLLRRRVRPGSRTVLGIGDDAAVIAGAAGEDLLLTTDTLVEGVHFTRRMKAEGIGWKAMACSISDIAAMGGSPTVAVVSLGAPPSLGVDFVKGIYRGMDRAARRFCVGIVGGDTVKSRAIVISVAMLGRVGKGKAVSRNGARPGDVIFLTGRIGRSLASGRHLSFIPRVREAQILVKRFRPSAMIDVSDGLLADLGHILRQSGVGALLHEVRIPRHRNAALPEALRGGEDFELIFTLSPKLARRLLKTRPRPFPCAAIGEITQRACGLRIVGLNGKQRKVKFQGYVHF